jgi:Holliday junction resolvasome RuvABC endonuclease subunit
MKKIKDNSMKRYERTMTYNEFVKSDLCKRMIKEEQRLLAERDKHEAQIVSIPSIFTAQNYSTVTDLAKLRGWSTSVPLMSAT